MRNASGHRCKVKIGGSEKKKKEKKKRFEDKDFSAREREHVGDLLHKTCN